VTRDRGFKRLVRHRAERTSESYSTARAHLSRRSAVADAELVTRCAAPLVRRLYGADPTARQTGVASLTRDQGALFVFWIFFAHAGVGLTGLCRTHPHRLVDPDFWTLIHTGLRDDAGLAAVVARLRSEVGKALERAPGDGAYEWLESLDTEAMGQLDVEFQTVMSRSLHRMADRIRAHADHFHPKEVTA
jgi:hypothetical protein